MSNLIQRPLAYQAITLLETTSPKLRSLACRLQISAASFQWRQNHQALLQSPLLLSGYLLFYEVLSLAPVFDNHSRNRLFSAYLDFQYSRFLLCHVRGVAQSGSAHGSGPWGRRFKSFRPDCRTLMLSNQVHKSSTVKLLEEIIFTVDLLCESAKEERK